MQRQHRRPRAAIESTAGNVQGEIAPQSAEVDRDPRPGPGVRGGAPSRDFSPPASHPSISSSLKQAH